MQRKLADVARLTVAVPETDGDGGILWRVMHEHRVFVHLVIFFDRLKVDVLCNVRLLRVRDQLQRPARLRTLELVRQSNAETSGITG